MRNQRGETVEVYDPDGNKTKRSYDAIGNQVLIQNYENGQSTPHSSTTFSYDAVGNKSAMVDPDMGNWTYTYNALGQLCKQTDAMSQVTRMHYDSVGRLQEQTSADIVSNWEYYNSPGKFAFLGSLKANTARHPSDPVGTYHSAQAFYYDYYGRPEVDMRFVDQKWFYSHNEYDNFSRHRKVTHFWRPKNLTDPESHLWHSYGIAYDYNSRSFVTEVKDSLNYVWWSTSEGQYDAHGRPLLYSNGNGVVTTNVFDPQKQLLSSTSSVRYGSTVNAWEFDYDNVGNVTWRKDVRNNLTEEYQYDSLNRVWKRKFGGGGFVEIATYHPNGNIQSKDVNNDGTLDTYDYCGNGGPHALNSVAGLSFSYNNNGNMILRNGSSVSWTSFNKPSVMADGLSWSLFEFNAERERVIQVSRNFDTGSVEKKLYIGAMEQSYFATSGNPNLHLQWDSWDWDLQHTRIYINGPGGVVGTYTHNPEATSPANLGDRRLFYYDHLGNIACILDGIGSGAEYHSYNIWGQRRDPADWSLISNPATHTVTGTDRGFTGHEMLDHLGLVHMNGRIYDPVVGRFLSADIYVQFPDNPQSYNRYSYTLNNPLTFRDPSGHFIQFALPFILAVGNYTAFQAMVIAFQLTFMSAMANGASLGNALRSGVISAASVWVSAQVGGYFDENFYSGTELADGSLKWNVEIGRAMSHGVAQGGLAEISGGDFGSGFLSSFSASLAGSGMQCKAGQNTFGNAKTDPSVQGRVMRTSAAAIVGGTTSVIGGGKFSNGAVTGAFIHLFNGEGRQGQKIEEVELNINVNVVEESHNFPKRGYGTWEANGSTMATSVALTGGRFENGKLTLSVDVTIRVRVDSDLSARDLEIIRFLENDHVADYKAFIHGKYSSDMIHSLTGISPNDASAFIRSKGPDFINKAMRPTGTFWDRRGYHNYVTGSGIMPARPSMDQIERHRKQFQ